MSSLELKLGKLLYEHILSFAFNVNTRLVRFIDDVNSYLDEFESIFNNYNEYGCKNVTVFIQDKRAELASLKVYAITKKFFLSDVAHSGRVITL